MKDYLNDVKYRMFIALMMSIAIAILFGIVKLLALRDLNRESYQFMNALFKIPLESAKIAQFMINRFDWMLSKNF